MRDLKSHKAKGRVKGNRRRREKTPRDWKRVFQRLLRVGLVCGSLALVLSGGMLTTRLLFASNSFRVAGIALVTIVAAVLIIRQLMQLDRPDASGLVDAGRRLPGSRPASWAGRRRSAPMLWRRRPRARRRPGCSDTSSMGCCVRWTTRHHPQHSPFPRASSRATRGNSGTEPGAATACGKP